MLALIRTLRPLNLLIIILTMGVLEYGLIAPILRSLPFHEAGGDPFANSRIDFAILIMATVLIAAAGNIINDYFDLRADRVNKPEKVLIGKRVKRRVAMLTHFVLNALALLLAGWVSWRSGVWSVLIFQLFAAAVLWFYSLYLKHRMLLGNLMIALITALIPFLPVLFEIPPLIRYYRSDIFGQVRDAIIGGEAPEEKLYLVLFWTLAYSAFAFITTLIREIQKDMADIEGDRKVGSQTLPIVIGEKRTRIFTGALIFLFLIGLAISWAFFLKDIPSLTYIIAGIGFPSLVSAFLLFSGNSRLSYFRASTWMKGTMLMGILFPIFVNLVGLETIFFP